jgi:hypothetical protein
MCRLELLSHTMQTLNSYEGFAEIMQWNSKHGPNNISKANVYKVGKGKGVPVHEGILQRETRYTVPPGDKPVSLTPYGRVLQKQIS